MDISVWATLKAFSIDMDKQREQYPTPDSIGLHLVIDDGGDNEDTVFVSSIPMLELVEQAIDESGAHKSLSELRDRLAMAIEKINEAIGA